MQGIFSSNAPNTPAVTCAGSNGAAGLEASSDAGTAIMGVSAQRFGIVGGTTTGVAVVATCQGSGIGMRATSNGGWAVNAQSKHGVGILGASDTNVGVKGECQGGYSFGVVGSGPNAGVAAFNPNNDHAAYLASDCCAAWLTGDVTITGELFKAGGGFRIDHPLQPAESFLSHSFVESSEMKNVYDGIAIAEENGEVTVELPKWFDILNGDFRYQLTPIGAPAPELHVLKEIDGGRFRIGGARAGMKVCWQVTGNRRDPWARANPLIVEDGKQPNEIGYFLHPPLYGAAKDKSIGHVRHPHREHLYKEQSP